jgi:hypothetical protein
VLGVGSGLDAKTAGGTSTAAKDDLLAECDRFIAEHREKADTNERRARWASWLLVGSTAAIPVFIIASTQVLDFAFGKLIPAILAAISAAIAGLLQFERLHERWSLYRRYQRLFEAERFLYVQGASQYSSVDRDTRFCEWLANKRLAVHDEWAGLVPASDQVAKAGGSTETNAH